LIGLDRAASLSRESSSLLKLTDLGSDLGSGLSPGPCKTLALLHIFFDFETNSVVLAAMLFEAVIWAVPEELGAEVIVAMQEGTLTVGALLLQLFSFTDAEEQDLLGALDAGPCLSQHKLISRNQYTYFSF
jgi:hypothetical protein